MRLQACSEAEETLWEQIESLQRKNFRTAKGLEYTFEIRGKEMFVSRKDKSITRATVSTAYRNALALDGNVTGPKQLRVFGASYIYPIFICLGVIKENPLTDRGEVGGDHTT